jgi:Caspase domain
MTTTRRTLLRSALASAIVPTWAKAANPGAARVALVIGNAAYAMGPLTNPTKDAESMSGLLRGLGFQVVQARDASRAQMLAAMAETRDRLKGQDGVGLLYYAGHGLQLDWRNYMLPVEVKLTGAADVPVQGVDVQAVLDAFKAAGNRMNILVLDACRDNPFPQAGTAKGLAPLDAPPGTFFAYATAPGNVAEDGSAADGNGLYTRFLLQELRKPQARIEDVFKRVRLQVRQASQGRQIPWESTSLEDDFIFATGQKASVSTHSRDADFDAEKADWDRIKESTRPEDVYAFLQRHPNGRISEVAQFRLDQLSKPAVQAVQVVRMLPPGTDRFRVGDSWSMRRTNFLDGGKATDLRAAVTAIDGARVLVNGGEIIFDQMGGMLLNRFGAKDPALLGSPADLQVGKRWRSAFTNTRPGGPAARSFYEHRCTALEDLEVPAGRFKAFRVEAQGESVVQDHIRLLETVHWVDPATMTVVRQDVKQTAKARGVVMEHSSDVLLWRKQVPRG